jgi:hypothetical protein
MTDKYCPFCYYEARSDLLRRHIISRHPYDTVINKRAPLSKNYFFQLPGEERKILVAYKCGVEDMPDTNSAFNMFYCFECHRWKETGHSGARQRFFDFCHSHTCTKTQERAKRKAPESKKEPIVMAANPYDCVMTDILKNADYDRYRDIIERFYTPEDEEEDEPATTGKEYLLATHKYMQGVDRQLQLVQQKAEARFEREKAELLADVQNAEAQNACLRTEIREQKELTDRANQQLCQKTEETARLAALLQKHKIPF